MVSYVLFNSIIVNNDIDSDGEEKNSFQDISFVLSTWISRQDERNILH